MNGVMELLVLPFLLLLHHTMFKWDLYTLDGVEMCLESNKMILLCQLSDNNLQVVRVSNVYI